MKKLIQGILDFRKNVLPKKRETFAKLADGQAPDVLFISCSDSRVAPNWFASTDPGDLFVIRNVGNLVPPHEDPQPREDLGTEHSVGAAIDFALANLKISHIVVCGHSGCGAIHAAAQGIQKLKSQNLKNWLRFVKSPENKTENKNISEDLLSKQNVLLQIENLKTYPSIQERLRKGKLKLHAWWFNIAEAGVFIFDESRQEFVLIDDTLGSKLLADE